MYNHSIKEVSEWLLDLRTRKGWTYTELAKISGYSISGLKEALLNGTIKQDAIDKIVSSKNLTEIYNSKFLQNYGDLKSVEEKFEMYGNKKTTLEDLAVLVIENWDNLLEDKFFKLQIENYAYEKAIAILKSKGVQQ